MKIVNDNLSFLDRISLKAYDYIYSLSVAKEVASSENGNGGVIIIGMVVVIIGLVGFIITKNNN